MDVVEVKAYSFLQQEITQRIIIKARSQNWSPLAQSVINQVVNHFSVYTPVQNQCFQTLVIQLTLTVYLSEL